jgi:hypothetical protein
MSSMANILLKDDAATPVETTFSPVTDTPHPLWRGQTSGIPFDGQPTVVVMANDRQKNGDYRRVLKINVPVMETLGTAGSSAGYQAAPKVAYNETFVVTQYSSGRSTTADRANSLKMIAGILAGASASSGTGTLDGASAGDAWKSSTALGPRLFIFGDSQY